MVGDRNGFAEKGRTRSITPAETVCALLIGAVAALGMLSGCGSSKIPKFYLLDPLARLSGVQPISDNFDMDLGIGPVKIPEYLNRSQIVRRTGRYEIDRAEFDKWGEPLESSIPRVVAENLSSLLSTENVFIYPWEEDPPEFRIQIDIVRFDSDPDGNVELTARWALLRGRDDGKIVWNKFSDKKPIAGQGYQGLVSAMSHSLYDMSHEIARHLMTEAIHGSVRVD